MAFACMAALSSVSFTPWASVRISSRSNEEASMAESVTPRTARDIEHAVVRFAGDSGDGMQLTGTEFTREAALHGNDLATFPDYPAEIRAPAGTTAGVSGYQIQFAAHQA